MRPFAERCPACFLRPAACLCNEVPRVITRTRVIVLRHVLEAYKSSNSARLAVAAMPNCELRSYGGLGQVLDERDLQLPGTWLLFPDSTESSAPPGNPPARLVVLDGNWRQARRMRQRITALRGLPTLSLPAPIPRPRLRRQRARTGMSTLEAIAMAVASLEGEAVAAPLLALYDTFVERTRDRATHGSPPHLSW